MVSKIQRMSRRIIAASATTILVLGAVGITLAHATSPNQTYTGCLKLGLVFNVAIGASPAFACPSGTTKITWNQTGPVGANGAKGTDGTNGTDGTDGTDGKSAYEIWLGLGNTGTVEEFISSLRGPAGTSGTNGTNGTNGVSVSSSSVAPGDANCPDGGSRFTSVSGSTFACNGAPGAAGGVAGQSGTSWFGTGGVTITPTTGFTLVPGLSATIDVPAGSFLFVTTTGGVQATSNTPAGFSTVDIFLSVDGSLNANGGYRRVEVNNGEIGSVFAYWSLATTLQLTPGQHTIAVHAEGVDRSNAVVSGDSSSVRQGTLNILTLKQ